MRMMLKIVIPTETGNQAIKDGSLHKIFEATMSKLKPERAMFCSLGYFTAAFQSLPQNRAAQLSERRGFNRGRSGFGSAVCRFHH